MRIVRLLALVTLAVSALAAGARAQSEPEEPTFFDQIDVQIINVDVFVRDAEGRPIRGLTRDDFEILEDGEPVEIANFFAMDGSAETGADDAGTAEAAGATSHQALPAGQQLHLLIFIDNSSLTPAARNRLVPEISDFIERRKNDSQQVTVATYDGGLQIRLPPTNRIEHVLTALEETMTHAGAQTDLELRGLLRELDRMDYAVLNSRAEADESGATVGTVEDAARRTYANIRMYAQNRYHQTQRALRHVREFVDALTSLDGRKAVLFVSEGLSLNPGEALFSAWERRFGGPAGSDLNRTADSVELQTGPLVREMAEYASSRRVTFYAVGGGSTGRSSGVRETSGGGLSAGGSGPSWGSSFEPLAAANRQQSLTLLAETTGGLSATGLGGIRAAVKQLDLDLADYYSLAYTPPHQRDGELHRVEVRVKNPDLVVRHRERYRAKSVGEEMRDRTRSALLLGESNNPLGVALDFGDEEEIDGGDYKVPVIVKIPIGRIVLLPQKRHHEGRLTLFLGARDEKGGTSEIFETEIPIRIPNEQVLSVLSRVGGFGINLSMRPGPHRIAVTVRDQLGKTQSVATADFEPGRLRVELDAPSASR